MSDDATVAERASEHADLFTAQSLEASLTVLDLAASVAWYRDVVGFAADREYRRDGVLVAQTMRAGRVRLLLAQDTGERGLDRAKGEGFSLQLTTTDDIDALAARIRARGGVLASEPADVYGVRAFRVRDPDGFRFAISAPRQG